MDGGLANCNIASSYSELGPCGQVSQAYRYNPSVRSFASTPFHQPRFLLHDAETTRSSAASDVSYWWVQLSTLPYKPDTPTTKSTQIRFAPGKIVLPSLTLLMASTKHRLFVAKLDYQLPRYKFCIICTQCLNLLFIYISKIDKKRKNGHEFNNGLPWSG